jgi:hypothetical protein
MIKLFKLPLFILIFKKPFFSKNINHVVNILKIAFRTTYDDFLFWVPYREGDWDFLSDFILVKPPYPQRMILRLALCNCPERNNTESRKNPKH